MCICMSFLQVASHVARMNATQPHIQSSASGEPFELNFAVVADSLEG